MSAAPPKSLPFAARFVTFVVCLCVGGAMAAIRWDAAPSVPPPALTVAPADLNLGAVWQQPALPFSLEIQNVSNRPVAVAGLSASCNCTEMQPTSFTVPARGSVRIAGTVDLLKSIAYPEWSEAPFAVTLTAVTTDRTPREYRWQIHGLARRALAVSPHGIHLVGAHEVAQGCDPPTVTLSITPRLDVMKIIPEWSPKDADVQLEGPFEDGRYELQYTPSRELPRGTLQSRVMLRTVLGAGEPGPDVEVPVRGMVSGPVRLVPSYVTVRPGQAGADGRVPLGVRLVSCDGGEWRIAGVVDPTGETGLEYDGSTLFARADDRNVTGSAATAVTIEVASRDGVREELSLTVVRVNPQVSVSRVPEKE